MVLGVLSSIRNKVKGSNGVNPTKGAIDNASLKHLTVNDLMDGDETIVLNKRAIVGEYLVQPQDELAPGYGSAQFPENQGTLFMDLRDGANAEVQGDVRILIGDFSNRRTEEVYSGSADDLRLGSSDLTKRMKFALQNWWGGHNDKIMVEYTPTDVGNGTLSKSNSTMKIASSVVPAQGLRNIA